MFVSDGAISATHESCDCFDLYLEKKMEIEFDSFLQVGSWCKDSQRLYKKDNYLFNQSILKNVISAYRIPKHGQPESG